MLVGGIYRSIDILLRVKVTPNTNICAISTIHILVINDYVSEANNGAFAWFSPVSILQRTTPQT